MGSVAAAHLKQKTPLIRVCALQTDVEMICNAYANSHILFFACVICLITGFQFSKGQKSVIMEGLAMEFIGKKTEFPIEQYKFAKSLGFGGQGIVLQYSRIDSLQVDLPESVAIKNIPESKAKWSRELDIMSLVAKTHILT